MPRRTSPWFLIRTKITMFCFVISLPISLQAQVTGSISGYVKDPSGAPVPGAQVTATLLSQNLSITINRCESSCIDG
jgi:hypothetical protein